MYKRFILLHVKASGPVSFASILAWLVDQYPGTVNHHKTREAIADLEESGELEKYDDKTWW
jgi:hypothetical protein